MNQEYLIAFIHKITHAISLNLISDIDEVKVKLDVLEFDIRDNYDSSLEHYKTL